MKAFKVFNWYIYNVASGSMLIENLLYKNASNEYRS